jgi:hypothetical protein
MRQHRAERRAHLAGLTCSFISDAYRIFELLTSQDDITTRRVSDEVATPKENGCKSLRAIVECRSSCLPVFRLGDGARRDPDAQHAMDFWASLEHKIYYKDDGEVPDALLAELKETADSANERALLGRDHSLAVTQLRGHDRLGGGVWGELVLVPDERCSCGTTATVACALSRPRSRWSR